VLWFVLTTGACNLRCRYCGGGFPPELVPYRPRFSAEELAEFILGRDPDPVVFFYGGEPLLNPRLIRELMDIMEGRARFGIQTNATLHHVLGDEYWARFDAALLSIDGVEEVTDRWRGRGVYRRVVGALRRLQRVRREHDGPGAIIARMTVTRDTVIDRDVLHLLGLGFDKVHWQLDAVWGEEWPVLDWARESYLPGLRRLAEWVAEAPWERLRRVVPFHGTVSRLLHGGPGGDWVPCGAGRGAFAVSTDGRILACPIAVRERWAELGTIWDGIDEEKLRALEEILGPCRGCPYFQVCGGRCLYAQAEKSYWSRERLEELDRVTRMFFDTVLSIVVPAALRAVEEQRMSPGDLLYDPLLESTEVVP
jgi:putative peptide-modifying radical SAM enzyme